MTDEEKDKEVILDDPSDDLKVEIEDDTPEEDRGRDRRAEGADPDIPDDEEVKDYSKRAQKRIKHIKWEYNEERRSKEEAQRIRDQAVDFARGQHNELVRLRQILARGESDLVTTNKAGAEARLESARAALRAANESGESEAITKSQEELARAISEADRWKGYRPVHQVDPNDPRMKPIPRPAPQPQLQVPHPTPEADEWAKRNPWFQNDERMTSFAFGTHADLIRSGVEVDSDEYYKKLDKEMARVFPSAFNHEDGGRTRQETPPSQRATVVASSSRSEGTPRKVKLTASMVALAKRLGITPEEYAREMLKQESGNG